MLRIGHPRRWKCSATHAYSLTAACLNPHVETGGEWTASFMHDPACRRATTQALEPQLRGVARGLGAVATGHGAGGHRAELSGAAPDWAGRGDGRHAGLLGGAKPARAAGRGLGGPPAAESLADRRRPAARGVATDSGPAGRLRGHLRWPGGQRGLSAAGTAKPAGPRQRHFRRRVPRGVAGRHACWRRAGDDAGTARRHPDRRDQLPAHGRSVAAGEPAR